MPNINETGASDSQMKSTLKAGLDTVSGNQEITFIKYNRTVLPLDGYIFWVKDAVAAPLIVQGSLHYETSQQQRSDETIGVNKLVFTTQEEVQEFNSIANDVAYIGAIDNIRFAFNSTKRRYAEAGTFHYMGDAIYPAMQTQISEGAPDLVNPIATNSMPIWLALDAIMPLYPAFLMPTNIAPPYAAVQISDTRPFQSAPLVDSRSSQYQLVTEKVKIIMEGLRNDQALQFQKYVMDDSLSSENFGIQNMPVIVDDVRGQSELGIIAQKKYIEFEINYYQKRVQDIARQLILNAGLQLAIYPWGVLSQDYQPTYSYIP